MMAENSSYHTAQGLNREHTKLVRHKHQDIKTDNIPLTKSPTLMMAPSQLMFFHPVMKYKKTEAYF